ncbi:MAG: hypothetical protein KGJ59_02425 [Bacteroidota bacterium]|nr:hypothetical protein [Bacteroidota bacterium]
MHYAWLIWSLFFLMFWVIIYLSKPIFRKEMLSISFWTMLLGLSEPLFVPRYWNPPTLFDLAQRTGFDIESLIFTFALGGTASVLYKLIYKKDVTKMDAGEMKHKRHKLHIYILSSPIPIFLALALLTSLNHIYCGIIAMATGALLTLYCRPDLKWKIWIGGSLLLIYYAVFFLSLIAVFPDYVSLVWNVKALTGILFIGIPVEELMFAFSFGMLWSSLYEHMLWYKIKT